MSGQAREAAPGDNPHVHAGLNLQEVIDYGKSKGIGIILYVNRRALERQRDEIFPLYQKWGVAGVKLGFVQVGPQKWTSWLLDTVRMAAAHKLLVDIHDSYRPTGFSRTFPNLLSQEGVRGNEHMPSASHNATLPFTRSPAGAADVTICYYYPKIKTTRAHQLALAVTTYSPLQLLYWYDKPAQYRGEPEIEFFDHVPTVWDETRVIHDRIGELVSIARRHGKDWYVGTICGDMPTEVELPLSFLAAGSNYVAHIYESGDTPTTVTRRILAVNATSGLTFKLPMAGGQAIWLECVN
jgi:alpha-glucosidase